jgi:hypothetical protein
MDRNYISMGIKKANYQGIKMKYTLNSKNVKALTPLEQEMWLNVKYQFGVEQSNAYIVISESIGRKE